VLYRSWCIERYLYESFSFLLFLLFYTYFAMFLHSYLLSQPSISFLPYRSTTDTTLSYLIFSFTSHLIYYTLYHHPMPTPTTISLVVSLLYAFPLYLYLFTFTVMTLSLASLLLRIARDSHTCTFMYATVYVYTLIVKTL